MDERSFGERLRACRAERRYTQQQLADRLGVSDKTVSKWECGGGYPDVSLLVPLARALGVTVDELLDGQSPLRQLQKQDWQNFLAFAFSLGGGLLCFLVSTFAPALLGYLVYLGCLAYGAYLQKYYCYKTRWFTLTGVGMLAFVHVSLGFKLVMLFYPLRLMGQVSWLEGMGSSPEFTGLVLQMAWPFLAALVLAAAFTAAGAALLRRYLAEKGQSPCLRLDLRLALPRPAQLWPCLAFALQAGFVALYAGMELPGFVYIHQTALFWALTLACGLGLAALYGPGRRWADLARALAALAAGRLMLATGVQGAYNMRDGHVLAPALFSPEISMDIYAVYQKPGMQMALFAVLVAAVYLALCCVRLWEEKTGQETAGPD